MKSDRNLQVIRDLLSQCTDEQRAGFERIFPGGIDNIHPDKIKNVILLCERTIASNNEPAVTPAEKGGGAR